MSLLLCRAMLFSLCPQAVLAEGADLSTYKEPFWRKLMYRAFVQAKAGCDKWHDYEMTVAPYDKEKPIYYEFTACPTAEFAIKRSYGDHARPVQCGLCVHGAAPRKAGADDYLRGDGCRCDYTICGDQDSYVKGHPEYRDGAGFRRNK